MAKTHQRLDYTRLAEALGEAGLVDQAALDDALQQCLQSGAMLTQILVDEGLVSDWEVARVACDVFGLPFVTVDTCGVSDAAREGLDEAFLRRFLLVPLDRYGDVLTVAMPCLVQSDVLTNLGRLAGAEILPVVGTVGSNRRWLEENMAETVESGGPAAALPGSPHADSQDQEWANLFDEADAAVQFDLTGTDDGSDGFELSEP